MAAPTAPTTTTLATEALKKAGYSSPTSAQLTRAWDYWGNEVKNDIWNIVKDLKFMMTESVIVTTIGLSRYSFPTDIETLLSASLLDGTHDGVCQDGGSTTTAKLATTVTATEDWMKGKWIVIYLTATPATAYLSQCIGFNTTTKVATVSPAWTPSPDSTYSFIVADIQYPLEVGAIWGYDDENYPTSKERPHKLHPIGDSDYGEFILAGAPDDTYAVKLRYYANLLTLDESGTLHGTLLKRWRNIFIQGILAKQLQDDDDDRAQVEFSLYTQYVNSLKLREKYGSDLSQLQATVEL